MQHEHYTHTAPDIPSSTFICPSFSPYQQATFASGCTGKFVRYCFCGIPICRPLLSELHAEITAVISTPQRHASLPDQLRMQPGIADVITVAKAAAQLRAAIFCAGVVIGTYRKRCSVPLPARESAVPQFPGKGSGHSRFLSVVIIAESVADTVNFFLCYRLDKHRALLLFVFLLFVSAVAVGPAGGKGVLPHKICHTARFAHGVVQMAQSRGQVVQP